LKIGLLTGASPGDYFWKTCGNLREKPWNIAETILAVVGVPGLWKLPLRKKRGILRNFRSDLARAHAEIIINL
jgi:hypothetical protein